MAAAEPGKPPLSLPNILLYSAGNLGANAVYALANTGFPLMLGSYPGVPHWLVGLLAQERSFVGAFIQPLVGWISDHLPPNRLGRRRPFFLVGVPLTAAALALLAAHPPLWAVILVMTFFSFFLAVAYDPYLALLPDIAPTEQRGRIGGVMAIFNMLGGILVLLLSFLLWTEHEPLVFYAVGGLLIASFLVTFLGVREPTQIAGDAEVVRGETKPLTPLSAVRWWPLGTFLASTFCFWLGNGGIVPFVTRFGVDVLGVQENVSFLLVLPAILGAAVFAVPSGLLAERLGKKTVLAGGQLLFGLSAIAGALLVHDVPSAVLAMLLVGVANAATTSLTFPLLTDLIPADRAATFTGVGSLVWSIAQPIGAVAAGALADQSGTLRGAFGAGGGAMLAAFALLLLVHVHPQGRPGVVAPAVAAVES